MSILPTPAEKSKSVQEFFAQGGQVEIPRPERCVHEGCGLREPLWKNGSYTRQVIYWGLYFLVQIVRFRCKQCGRTASRPYSWLVPYRRFSAEMIAAGIEAYSGGETTYRDLMTEYCSLENAEAAVDVRAEPLYEDVVQASTSKLAGPDGEPRLRPAHTTIFHWVNFACSSVEELLVQVQKELVESRKRGREIAEIPQESLTVNPNRAKAFRQEKARKLDSLSYVTAVGSRWWNTNQHVWDELRAYFCWQAESCKDIFTKVPYRYQVHRGLN